MGVKVGGERPRPRVALLGQFPGDDIERFMRMFPTVWSGLDFGQLRQQVHVSEVDLLIIAPEARQIGDWMEETHVICFSSDIDHLPGPTDRTKVYPDGHADTEEFLLPDVPLPISRRREADLAGLDKIKGWRRLKLHYFSYGVDEGPEDDVFNKAAIISERGTKAPLAVAFVREENSLGVAWLPFGSLVDRAFWVEVLVTLWAECDPVRLPNFGDWVNSPDWMTPEEERIVSEIEGLEQEKQRFIVDIDRRIGEAAVRFGEAQRDAGLGLRRLITAQGDELVGAVSTVLQDLGFRVENVDKSIPEGEPRREDLRLRQPIGLQDEWEAIVEVRGYARSSGKTSDLQRLGRFADLYEKEKGRFPDRRVYIVNGQLELLPPQREAPLLSSEDIEIFGESDGIVVWTLDLFKVMKRFGQEDYPMIRESIQNSVGRWSVGNVAAPKHTREKAGQ